MCLNFFSSSFPLILVLHCLATGGNDDVKAPKWNSGGRQPRSNSMSREYLTKNIWMESNFTASAIGGDWQTGESCTTGAIVVGYRFKTIDPMAVQNNDPAKTRQESYGITGIGLQCARLVGGSRASFEGLSDVGSSIVGEIRSGFGDTGRWQRMYKINNPAIGYSFIKYRDMNGQEKEGGWQIRFHGEFQNGPTSGDQPQITRQFLQEVGTVCPQHYAVCGVQTRLTHPVGVESVLDWSDPEPAIEARATLFPKKKFRGNPKSYTTNGRNEDEACDDLDGSLESLDTQGTCVRLYSEKGCTGEGHVVRPGSSSHSRIRDEFNWPVHAIGPCHRSDVHKSITPATTPFPTRRGQPAVISGIRLECCYFCHPVEKQVVIFETKNPGNETKTIHFQKRVQVRFPKHFDQKIPPNSVDDDGDQTDGGGDDSDLSPDVKNYLFGKAQTYLHQKYGQPTTQPFDWISMNPNAWQSTTLETETIVCPAGHHCMTRQMTGKCGLVQIQTPNTTQHTVPIGDESYDNKNEIWISPTTENNLDQRAQWGPIEKCPGNHFVTGFNLKQKNDTNDPAPKLYGLLLQCSPLAPKFITKFQATVATTISSQVGLSPSSSGGQWPTNVTKVDNYVWGFSLKIRNANRKGGAEGVLFESIQFHGERGPGPLESPPNFENDSQTDMRSSSSSSVYHKIFNCPQGFGVCGLQTKLKKEENDSQNPPSRSGMVATAKATLYTENNFKGTPQLYNSRRQKGGRGQCDPVLGTLKSLNTHGSCVRLYAESDCEGQSRDVKPGTDHHEEIQRQISWSISSIGPCNHPLVQTPVAKPATSDAGLIKGLRFQCCPFCLPGKASDIFLLRQNIPEHGPLTDGPEGLPVEKMETIKLLKFPTQRLKRVPVCGPAAF